MDSPRKGNKLQPFMPKFVQIAFTLFLLAALAACSSISVDKVTPLEHEKLAPAHIYVQDFVTPPQVLRVDRGGKSFNDFQSTISKQIAFEVAKRVNKRLAPSSTLPLNAPTYHERAWLVTGQFLTVKQGSRILRIVFGLGAGGTKVETLVTVYDLSVKPPRPILKFVTTGGSNAQPGVIFGLAMPNYWLIGLDVAGHIAPGLSFDVARTSRQIVAVLSEYMAQEGMIPAKKVYRAKKLGKWP